MDTHSADYSRCRADSQRRRQGSTRATILHQLTSRAEKSCQPETISSGVGSAAASALHVCELNLQAQLRRRALKEARQGNHAIAIALFSQLIEQNPHSALDYNNRGLVYFQCDQHDRAIADYNQAIELDSTLDSAYNNRANYFAQRGLLLQAILDYDTALDLNPQNVRAWINQGITFRDLRMYDRAIESFEAALDFGMLEGHIYAERGRTYHLRGDWNCAIADYKRALTHLPSQIESPGSRSARLYQQVEHWFDSLLSPLNF